MSDSGSDSDLRQDYTQIKRQAMRHSPSLLRKLRRKFQIDNTSLLKMIAHGRVLKKRSAESPQPPMPNQTRPRPGMKSPRYRPEDYDRALSWFRKIMTLGLVGVVPSIIAKDEREIEREIERGIMEYIKLQYPEAGYWSLTTRLHCSKKRHLPKLTTQQVQDLCRFLTHDIALLYDAHIPFKVEIGTMTIAMVSSQSPKGLFYKPLIDNFDLDVDPQDEDVPWENLKQKTIKSTEDQFAVLEAIVEYFPSQPKERRADLEPDAAVSVLEAYPFTFGTPTWVIRHVSNYSTRLARFLIQLTTEEYLYSYPEPIHDDAWEYCKTVAYVLQLAESPITTAGINEDELLLGRIKLLALHTALLIHRHKKIVPYYRSRGIIGLERENEAARYVDVAGFQLVTDARRKLATAIDSVAELNRCVVDEETKYLLETLTARRVSFRSWSRIVSHGKPKKKGERSAIPAEGGSNKEE